MPEFASNGKGNLAVTLGAIGTGLGALSGTGVLSGLFGKSSPSNPQWVSKDEFEKQNEISSLQTEISLLKAEKDSESKMIDVFERLSARILTDERSNAAQFQEQAVYNATNTANINCMQNSINQLYSMTKLYIPSANVSPQPMPLYNSWATPTGGTGNSTT